MRLRLTGALVAALIVICGGARAISIGMTDEEYAAELSADAAEASAMPVKILGKVETISMDVDDGCIPVAGMENRSSDLCAQWKAADSARDAANWGQAAFWLSLFSVFVGAGLSAVTLYYLKKTFEETKVSATAAQRSADEGAKAADAAIRATAISATQAAIQNRPWLAISIEPNGKLDVERDRKDGIIEIVAPVKFNIFNAGSSPAIDVIIYCSLCPWQFGLSDEENRNKFVKEKLEIYCDDEDDGFRGRNSSGEAVFPNVSIVFEKSASINWKLAKDHFDEDGTMVLMLVGALFYKGHGDGGPKLTSFIYDVRVNGDDIIDTFLANDLWESVEFKLVKPGLIDAT